MMRLLFCLVLAACFAVPAAGQGFNAFNGRNHPELDWQVAETAHFRIMYPAHLAGIEAEAAAVAEASYDVLAANLGVTFGRKIRIYLSDEDEIANGFAVPIGAGYTNIWVRMNDVAAGWTGREKWLRKVIAHELAHIFHFKAVRTPLGPFAVFFGEPLPRFWTEGLAQYQTETWDAYRGERWLRTAVLDDQLSYNDGRSVWNGRLLYAVGNAQVRRFAEQYGDTTLAQLLAHRKPVLLGLTKVHDFYKAFEEVTGEPYRVFYDDWRRLINVQYNTLAGQMEAPDSLGPDPLKLGPQYLSDVRFSPDTTRLAVVGLASLRRPVRRLWVMRPDGSTPRAVAEGAVQSPVTWSPDGTQLAFARRGRGRHGSLVNDLYLVDADGKHRRRLTEGRRATSPSFAPDGRRIAFAGSEGGTANLFVLDLATGDETALTSFTGDVQIGAVRWHPSADKIAFARFDADGTRAILVLDLGTGTLAPLTGGAADDRGPVWSPDGAALAFTSLADGVPNVFVHDLATGTQRRVTNLATGAEVHDWLPPDSAHAAGTLVVTVAASKTRDRAYRLDAARTAEATAPVVPPGFTAWTRHRPPETVPTALAPRPDLIERRYRYRALRNLTHAGSLVVPYFNDPDDWGVFGFTAWIEPLAKHQFFGFGSLSIPSFRSESFFTATYVNNQFKPTLFFSAYRIPGRARYYGNDLLAEQFNGGDVTMIWPLDVWSRPYAATTLGLRVRAADIVPLNPEDFDTTLDDLPSPVSGQEADLRLSLTHRRQRPYADNIVHPLDGFGVRLRVTGAAQVLGTESRFLRGDLAAYGILPALGQQRLFVYGRVKAQTGTPLAQDVIGLARRDRVFVDIDGFTTLTAGDEERVRGYRRFAIGTRVAFGSVEYRVPLVPDLQTRVLGFLELGTTTAALFADGGLVWTGADFDGGVKRLGLGIEVKNAIRLGGTFTLMHALGLAQPHDALGSLDDYDLYYRIQAAVPF